MRDQAARALGRWREIGYQSVFRLGAGTLVGWPYLWGLYAIARSSSASNRPGATNVALTISLSAFLVCFPVVVVLTGVDWDVEQIAYMMWAAVIVPSGS